MLIQKIWYSFLLNNWKGLLFGFAFFVMIMYWEEADLSLTPIDSAKFGKSLIKIGSRVKITHRETGKSLHSHKTRYSSGSLQQQVTCMEPPGDENDFWLILPLQDDSWNAVLGRELQNNEKIVLGHFETNQNLHSHQGVVPPVSKLHLGYQEVSCFSGKHEDEVDENDFWRIQVMDNSRYVKSGSEIQIQHYETKKYLHSHPISFYVAKDLSAKQQEVTCYDKSDTNTIWILELI